MVQAAVERPELSTRAKHVVFATIVLGLLMASLDQTIVSTSLPSIVGDLGGAGHVSWVVTAYLLTDTIMTVVAGKLGTCMGASSCSRSAWSSSSSAPP
jgi:MFS family permease